MPSYRKVVRALRQQYGKAIVCVVSLLPVLLPWVSNDDIAGTNKQLAEMAKEESALYLDVHSRFIENGRPVRTCLMEDGVHLSDKVYRVWSAEIEKIL